MLNKYFIKDLGKGFGAFMRVVSSVSLKTDSLINIGDSYIVVSLGDDCNSKDETDFNSNSNNDKINVGSGRCVTDSNYSLHLKIYSGQLKIEPRYFFKLACSKQKIKQ